MGQIPDEELVCAINPGQSDKESASWKNRNIRACVHNVAPHANIVVVGQKAEEGMREIDWFLFLDGMVQTRRSRAKMFDIREGHG